jgi:sortase A
VSVKGAQTLDIHESSNQNPDPKKVSKSQTTWYSGLVRYVVLSIIAAIAIVPLLVGPTINERDKTVLAKELAARFAQAESALGTEDLSPLPSQAFEQGSPIAILEIPKLEVQEVVIEGSSGRDTARAVGHLFGSSGPGQEGNAVLIGRSVSYGAPFKDIGTLETGDEVVILTIQGKAKYIVDRNLESTATGYMGPSFDNRLTLITASPQSLASSLVVVTATLEEKPFVSYPQNPAWLATHPSSPSSFPIASLLVILVGVLFVGFGYKVVSKFFSRTTVLAIFIPVFLAQSVVLARILFDFLPPSF